MLAKIRAAFGSAALLFSAAAFSFIMPSDLASNVKSAETNVDATIVDVRPQTWIPTKTPDWPAGIRARELQICGLIYTVRVNERLKGTSDARLRFAVAPVDKLGPVNAIAKLRQSRQS